MKIEKSNKYVLDVLFHVGCLSCKCTMVTKMITILYSISRVHSIIVKTIKNQPVISGIKNIGVIQLTLLFQLLKQGTFKRLLILKLQYIVNYDESILTNHLIDCLKRTQSSSISMIKEINLLLCQLWHIVKVGGCLSLHIRIEVWSSWNWGDKDCQFPPFNLDNLFIQTNKLC